MERSPAGCAPAVKARSGQEPPKHHRHQWQPAGGLAPRDAGEVVQRMLPTPTARRRYRRNSPALRSSPAPLDPNGLRGALRRWRPRADCPHSSSCPARPPTCSIRSRAETSGPGAFVPRWSPSKAARVHPAPPGFFDQDPSTVVVFGPRPGWDRSPGAHDSPSRPRAGKDAEELRPILPASHSGGWVPSDICDEARLEPCRSRLMGLIITWAIVASFLAAAVVLLQANNGVRAKMARAPPKRMTPADAQDNPVAQDVDLPPIRRWAMAGSHSARIGPLGISQSPLHAGGVGLSFRRYLMGTVRSPSGNSILAYSPLIGRTKATLPSRPACNPPVMLTRSAGRTASGARGGTGAFTTFKSSSGRPASSNSDGPGATMPDAQLV